MRRTLAVAALALLTTAGVFTSVERGNRLYRAGKYEAAVAEYRAVLADGDDTPVLRYNLGTALLRLGRYREAEEHLRAALDAVDPTTREWVYYNLGQRFLEDARAEDGEAATTLYDAAVEAYRQALRLRPGDGDAKWNYELALRERERQMQGGGGGDQDEREQEEQEGGQGQGGSAPGRNQPSEAEPSQGPQGQQSPMTQEQAERILSA
nr:tetratricopeptide repeat protein [Gemmatimonadota bacterium]NIQ55266.1 tetratricopeptide repeat protein [Gemmatimonadota bacterium]NIU75467.1 tetratricopeptide repeat protein [Gammaproteobacteria bacterium]NIX45195.1 tetratricopeptide repeat protein [Gemmatimonadota bacterium]NIY09451.1 tetratricopeptide repeat protein [Gemmatimonadota bacterium]